MINKEIVTNKNLDILTRSFQDDEYTDIDVIDLYMVLFKRIPKYKRVVEGISMGFYETLKKEGELIHSAYYNAESRKSLYGRHLFYYKDSLVSFFKKEKDDPWGTVTFATDDSNFEDEVFQNKVPDGEEEALVYFGIVLQGSKNLKIKKFPLNMPQISVPLQYGEGFVNKNEAIIKSIKQNHHGLYLFHGPPGTGKTTYIKYLAHLLGDREGPTILEDLFDGDAHRDLLLETSKSKEKLFVYLPTQLMDTVTDPSFASLLLEQKNDIVLILEDAEQYIKSREDESNYSAVATLLNLTDGIMGSILNVSIIVTFNTEPDKIDTALKRKGRLFAEHRFENLSIEDSQKLLNNLKINHKAEKPMSLAEIYNFELENFAKEEKEKNNIGFGT